MDAERNHGLAFEHVVRAGNALGVGLACAPNRLRHGIRCVPVLDQVVWRRSGRAHVRSDPGYANVGRRVAWAERRGVWSVAAVSRCLAFVPLTYSFSA